jgi:hypothetical protein
LRRSEPQQAGDLIRLNTVHPQRDYFQFGVGEQRSSHCVQCVFFPGKQRVQQFKLRFAAVKVSKITKPSGVFDIQRMP